MSRSEKELDFETKQAVIELAYQISQGLTLEKACSVTNIDETIAS